ncbi:MAG: four helix bundle protein [Candidatus Moranbacteria bacterium]|jgi:four helix bundle protein|nr:four helix bundle protein [Candidatus Moranbacteria bacterium]
MSIQTFEDIEAWKKSRILVSDIYGIFSQMKDYGFRDQIQRAAVSVMNNIAEGFERKSDKELKNFLFIAKGSSGEVRSMLYIALDLGYINQRKFDTLYGQSVEISRMLSGFIKRLA